MEMFMEYEKTTMVLSLISELLTRKRSLFTLKNSESIVRFLYDRYNLEFNDRDIDWAFNVNYFLYHMFSKGIKNNTDMNDEQKEMIEVAAKEVVDSIIFKRAVEITNSITIKYKTVSRVKELLTEVLYGRYERSPLNAEIFFAKINKDIKGKFVKPFELNVNGKTRVVFGELLELFASERDRGLPLSLESIIPDLAVYRPASKWGIMSISKKLVLFNAPKEGILLDLVVEYQNFIKEHFVGRIGVHTTVPYKSEYIDKHI